MDNAVRRGVELPVLFAGRVIATSVLVFSAVLMASPGNAVASDDVGPQATTQQLIEAVQGGASVFRADPSGAAVHIQSGMACVPGAEKMRLAGLFVSSGATLGDDVGCDYVVPDGKTTVSATRLGNRTLQSAAAALARAIKQTFTDAQQIGGPLIAGYPGLQTPIAGSWSCTFNGKPSVTSVWLVQQDDWLVEVRATYPAGERHDPELLAAMAVINAQVSISKSANR